MDFISSFVFSFMMNTGFVEREGKSIHGAGEGCWDERKWRIFRSSESLEEGCSIFCMIWRIIQVCFVIVDFFVELSSVCEMLFKF